MQINIDDRKLAGFADQAKSKVTTHITSFADDIIKESLRLESSTNPNGTGPEVTSTMVDTAEKLLRGGITKKKTPPFSILLKVVNMAAWAFVGSLFSLDKLKDPTALYAFLLTLIFAAITSTMIFLKFE